MPRSIALAVALALVIAASGRARGDIEGDRFESSLWRVSMSAPKNWQLTEKTAYPNILLRLVRRSPDGKMMLAAERVAPGVDALAYARRTAEILRTMQFQVRSPQLHSSTGAYFIDSQGRGSYVRQAFLVADGVGYSLTLSAPDNRTRSQHLRAFDYALRSIQILRASRPPPDPPGGDPNAQPAGPPQRRPPPAAGAEAEGGTEDETGGGSGGDNGGP